MCHKVLNNGNKKSEIAVFTKWFIQSDRTVCRKMAGNLAQVLAEGPQVPALKDAKQVQVLEDGEKVQELDKVPLQGHQDGPGLEKQGRCFLSGG